MLKNKNRLIHPQHLTKEDAKDEKDFFYRAYLNALQYYADDPTHNLDNISLASIFLYSMGDRHIAKSPDKKLNEFEIQKIASPSSNVINEIDFYADNLVGALQFRLENRKYVLDINTYNYESLKDFLDVDVNFENEEKHTLFKLLMRNFKLKYFTSLDKKEAPDTLSDILEESPESKFLGIFDNANVQDRYSKKSLHRQIFELDGYFKAGLKEWQIKYNKKSLIDNFNVDMYPYVDAILYDNGNYFITIALKERDENYIDNKTEEINKVFECSMFIYRNANQKVSAGDLTPFKENLYFYLGKFINDCSLNKLQDAMNGAIGEAADISRHWYSKGLDSIFNDEMRKRFENDLDSINFYSSFVEKLLCRIEGVNNTEIYPFDRIFILPESGLAPNYKGIRHMSVIEAKIKSKEPLDRGGYLMGWEQDVEENGNKVLDEQNDLIFSDKKINRMDWNLELNEDKFVNEIIEDSKFVKANSLLLNLLFNHEKLIKEDDIKKLTDMKRKIRDEFNEYGLFYEYEFGLDISKQFPVLYDLQDLYLKKMALKSEESRKCGIDYNESIYDHNLVSGRYRDVLKAELIANRRKNIRDEYKAKTVTVCFDPERITKPELTQTRQHLKRKNSITMIFVADKDIIKTTSELQAEIEDFKVLVQMVIRQVISDVEKEQGLKKERKRLQEVIPQTLHTVKGYSDDADFKDKIDVLLKKVKASYDTEEIKFYEFKSSNIFNEVLNKLFDEESTSIDAVNLENRVDKWLPENHNVSIVLHNSILPKMKIPWGELFIPEAFNVILKNAIEHTYLYSKVTGHGNVTISMITENIDETNYLTVNIINNTTQLTKSRFDALNNEETEEMVVNKEKNGSTGIGVVLARKQLKSISSFNNISFVMLASDVISVKLRLKIELVANNELFLEEDIANNKEMLDIVDQFVEHDIVYFEDSPEYYNQNISLLKSYNLSIAHDVRKNETFMSTAKLLLTDMSILNNNQEIDEEEGLDSILSFRKLNTVNAPICVLSNGEADDIKKKILIHLDDMIDSADVIIMKDFNIPLEDGKIFILNNVKTLNNTHVTVLDYIKSLSTENNNNNNLQNNIPNEHNYEIVQFTNKGEYTLDFISLFSNLQKEIAHKYFYVANSSSANVKLADTLIKWFEYKTARANKKDEQRAVSNVTYHKNTLLIIDDISLEDEREKWWLFYLGITHNVIFNFLDKSHSDLLAQWNDVAVKRESSGYLGKLRHDIKNYQKIYEKYAINTNLNKEFENIINNTFELQKIFQLSIYESLKHFILLSESKKLKRDTSAFSNDNEEVLKYVSEIEKLINEILLSLKEVIKIMSNESIEKTKENTNIKNLKLFKELIELNIEFCTNKVQG